jgi:8-oxo-dGTP pyrophosphatase MutT (NUDIX family)
MLSDINDFADRVRPVGVLYVDVHPFRISASGEVMFLLLRRGEGMPLAGQWQTVSGKIQKGERIADAFARQVRKKTGCLPTRLFKMAEVTTFYDEYYDTVMMVPGAAARLDEEAEIQIDRSLHVEHRWVDLADAGRLLPWSGQHRALSVIASTVATDVASDECTPLSASAFLHYGHESADSGE